MTDPGLWAPMRFAVDGWDPGYGTSLGIDGAASESVTSVITDIELPPDRWTAIQPSGASRPHPTIFVDGVRRIDARIWIDDIDPVEPDRPANEASMALCASYAAGAVCCCDRGAHVLPPEVRRGLFTVAPHAMDVATRAGLYRVFPTVSKADQGLEASLSAALQRQLGELELIAAAHARRGLAGHDVDDDTLLVVDGPVRGREQLARVLGFVKSHQLAYLEPPLHALVGTLRAAERTPVFLLGRQNWNRFTWYLRLPGLPGQPWAGIARVECAANLPGAQAVALANLSQTVLPRFASAEYKDSRAPQNLYPVAGLERELRRRLGHHAVLYRALRLAAAAAVAPT